MCRLADAAVGKFGLFINLLIEEFVDECSKLHFQNTGYMDSERRLSRTAILMMPIVYAYTLVCTYCNKKRKHKNTERKKRIQDFRTSASSRMMHTYAVYADF